MQIKKQCKYDETSKRLNICLYISKTLFKGFLDACRHRNTNNAFSTNERNLPIKLAYLICISMLNLSVDLSLYLIKMCVCCNVSTKYNAYQKLPFITTNVMLQVSISFEILRIVVVFVIMFPCRIIDNYIWSQMIRKSSYFLCQYKYNNMSTYVANFNFIPRFISFSCIYDLNFVL